MTSYSSEDFYKEVQEKKKLQQNGTPDGYVCAVCGEILKHKGEYHSDECDIVRGYLTGRDLL